MTAITMDSTPCPRKSEMAVAPSRMRDQDVLELFEQDFPRRNAADGLQFVRAVLGQAALGFGMSQPARAAVQVLEGFFGSQGVPERGSWHGVSPLCGAFGF